MASALWPARLSLPSYSACVVLRVALIEVGAVCLPASKGREVVLVGCVWPNPVLCAGPPATV